MKADGSDERHLAALGSFIEDITLSPDGTKIAFSNASDGQIWVMGADGSGLTKLTAKPDAQPALSPEWSPDGTRIAFASGLALWLVNVDGAGERLLAESIHGGTKIAWSPDGRIAFNCGATVCVVRPDGTGLILYPDAYLGQGFSSPIWSPDGKMIAFAGFSEPELDIYVMNSDGSGLGNLTEDFEAPADEPAWSPDGKRIAFVGNALDIYVMNADGSGLKRLTKSRLTEIYDGAPSWSPDGRAILFSCSKIGVPENTCVIKPDGSGLKRLNGGEAVWLPAAEPSAAR